MRYAATQRWSAANLCASGPFLSSSSSRAHCCGLSRSRDMANFAAADQAGLVRIIKRKMKKIQYRPHLINGCLTATGLKSNPGDLMHYDFNLVRAGRLLYVAAKE